MTKKEFRKVYKWFFTFPDSKDRDDQWIFKLWKDDIYFYENVCGVKEIHESGNPHLHFWIHLKHPIAWKQIQAKVKALEPNDYKRVDWVAMRSTVQRCHDEYGSKEGVPWIKHYKEKYLHYVKRTNYSFWKQMVDNKMVDGDTNTCLQDECPGCCDRRM